MKITFVYFVYILCISGCASTLELKPTGSYIYKASSQKAYDYIRGRTHECWRKTGGHFQDGIYVSKANVEGLDAIAVSSTNMNTSNMYDYRLHKNLIAQIVFRPVEDNLTQVEISEGGLITGGTHGLNADIERWIGGDRSCGNSH